MTSLVAASSDGTRPCWASSSTGWPSGGRTAAERSGDNPARFAPALYCRGRHALKRPALVPAASHEMIREFGASAPTVSADPIDPDAATLTHNGMRWRRVATL